MKKMVDAEKLMERAWDNPMLSEADCAMLYKMIVDVQREEEKKRGE